MIAASLSLRPCARAGGRARAARFVDPHFPPDDSSLFADPARAGANADAKQTFRPAPAPPAGQGEDADTGGL